ncbi:MAG: hypothetical protein L6Q97_27225, partial [Thermoanaerobaculia bacterium]|nr:hypothetical protein [Thermoanaerobaculia bacterium]
LFNRFGVVVREVRIPRIASGAIHIQPLYRRASAMHNSWAGTSSDEFVVGRMQNRENSSDDKFVGRGGKNVMHSRGSAVSRLDAPLSFFHGFHPWLFTFNRFAVKIQRKGRLKNIPLGTCSRF